MNPDFMKAALKEAYTGIEAKDGGPFGSVVVKNNTIVGRGHNQVIAQHDPTCHGEIQAIRDACRNLGTHDLSGCELYTAAEPCPMCLGAILWANIKAVYYGCTRHDSARIGFRDDAFYQYLEGASDEVTLVELGRAECLELFETYSNGENERY